VPGEETIDFADYKDFQVDIQAGTPRVKCYDLRRLHEPLTPNAEFFVFHQTTVPPIDIGTWKLEIGGFAARPGAFSLAELAEIAPRQELEFTIECSGNL